MIGADKSRIWFSSHTPDQVKQYAMLKFGAQPATQNEVYLGAPVTANRASDFAPLIKRIEARLQPWKSALLSAAGKLTLIKAVIEPTLLYALQTATVPSSTLNEIQKKVRAFFWNNGSDKRMPLVAWDRITTSKGEGGLGLKDYIFFAKTVRMKSLWGLMVVNRHTIWGETLKAKYLARTNVWTTERTRRCTATWRGMLAVREEFDNSIRWQLGNGMHCGAFSQPWHDLWQEFTPVNTMQRRMVVADLVDSATGKWNIGKLIDAYGFYGALYIAVSLPHGPNLSNRDDRLLYTPARNGNFSIKVAYKMLRGRYGARRGSVSQQQRAAFLKMWNMHEVVPKCKLFLWKLLHNALPVDQVISRRTGIAPKGCALCGHITEDVHHMLLSCPKARQVWLASNLGIRTDQLPPEVNVAIAQIWEHLQPSLLPTFVAIAWEIWKNRCKATYEGKDQRVISILHKAHHLTTIAAHAQVTHVQRDGAPDLRVEPLLQGYYVFSDGSWTNADTNGAAWAYILWHQGVLLQYQAEVGAASSPLITELRAIKAAVTEVSSRGISDCSFYTDCMELQLVLTEQLPPEMIDWRAYTETLDLLHMLRDRDGFKIIYVNRDFNVWADRLAKYARERRVSFVDFTLLLIPSL